MFYDLIEEDWGQAWNAVVQWFNAYLPGAVG